MNRIKLPSKEATRAWLQQRRVTPMPLPDIAQIQRELGWKLIDQTPKPHSG